MKTVPILEALCARARPIILKYASIDSCIASTRIGMEVLRRLKIQSSPLAVKVVAFNKKGSEFMLAKHPEWVREQKDGAYGVGIGHGHGKGTGWDGHLVLIVRDGTRYLLDLSIDQASRPQHGIVLTPFYTPYTGEPLTLEIPNGGAIIYETEPDNKEWKQAPDWNLKRWSNAVEEVLEALPRNQ